VVLAKHFCLPNLPLPARGMGGIGSKEDKDISSLPNLLKARQTTALTLEAVKVKLRLISFPAWVSD